jgi:hypothetical protein
VGSNATVIKNQILVVLTPLFMIILNLTKVEKTHKSLTLRGMDESGSMRK